ncbi:hypothetical protein K438DRAFT_1998157 [Mycena galopus ATCC 62051]|nr:hypothetical protein K438DRAFT_1998157 [Mycena galopus ATCC 62051]
MSTEFLAPTELEKRQIRARISQNDPYDLARAKENPDYGRVTPKNCAWCRVSAEEEMLYRRWNQHCRGGLSACSVCILVAHEQHPLHTLQAWTDGRYWKVLSLRSLGYVYQEGHDGEPCPNPALTTTSATVQTTFEPSLDQLSMPPALQQRCYDEEDRKLRRLATYRKYRRTHLADRREKTRRAMADLRARETPVEREARRQKNREAQKKYCDKYREQIAHRARRAAVARNAAAGKETKLRPKARHYWSDPELLTDDEEDSETEW